MVSSTLGSSFRYPLRDLSEGMVEGKGREGKGKNSLILHIRQVLLPCCSGINVAAACSPATLSSDGLGDNWKAPAGLCTRICGRFSFASKRRKDTHRLLLLREAVSVCFKSQLMASSAVVSLTRPDKTKDTGYTQTSGYFNQLSGFFL